MVYDVVPHIAKHIYIYCIYNVTLGYYFRNAF